MTNEAKQGGWWTGLAGVAALMVLLGAFIWEPAWDAFGVFQFKPYFADTIAILAAGDAHRAGADIYMKGTPFDPFGRPHVYGPGWLVTDPLGLTVKDAPWLGAILVLAFLAAAAAVVAPKTGRDALLAVLLLCSPPAMLGMHRANNDLVVFLLLVAGAWLLSRPRGSAFGGSALLLSTAATLKLYPFVALPALLLRRGRWRTLLAVFAATCVFSLGVVWSWRADFLQALRLAPRPETIFAYGLSVLSISWHAIREPMVLAVGWVVGLGAVVLSLRRRWTAIWRSVPLTGFTSACFFAGAACWVFCYFANSNYPYRAVLVLLAARLWLQPAGDPQMEASGRWQLGWWLFAVWLGMPKHWCALWSVNADARASGLNAPWAWLQAVVGIEQGMLLALTLALGVAIAGLVVRRWQEREATDEPR